ncbi:MAG: DUF2169 domain-containing protein [Polyangiaceae bacterium]
MIEQRLANDTLTNARIMAAPTSSGAPGLVAVVKLALRYELDGGLHLASRGVRLTDVRDEALGLVGPSDLAFEKGFTDLGVVGVADAPDTAREHVVGVRAGSLERAIRFVARRGLGDVGTLRGPLPLALDPRLTIELASPFERAGAASLGPVSEDEEPRRSRLGTFDEGWARDRAPLPPRDRHPLADSWAQDSLRAAQPWIRPEPIELIGVHAEQPRLTLRLPSFQPRIGWELTEREHVSTPALDGVLVDTRSRTVELTWRAGIPRPKKLASVRRVHVSSAIDLPETVRTAQNLQPYG